jgi:Family of unknown function (DUF5832)
MKEIDYLFEDPPVPTQKYALVSIVGPHMPQKCDVWALKLRGVADTLDKAKSMTQRLLRVYNNFDIYTVEVGKFFPLAVEPHQISNVEYQNSELNKLIKNYLENRELANEYWHKRKDEMIKEAIKEGRNQEELALRPEHPVSVLQRIRDYEKRIEEARQSLSEMEEELEKSREKFAGYTDEEREIANNELKNAIEEAVGGESSGQQPQESSLSVEEIRKQLLTDLNVSNEQASEANVSQVDETITKLQALEQELHELKSIFNSVSKRDSPITHKKLKTSIEKIEKDIEQYKSILQDSTVVNNYINSKYGPSNVGGLEQNVMTAVPFVSGLDQNAI